MAHNGEEVKVAVVIVEILPPMFHFHRRYGIDIASVYIVSTSRPIKLLSATVSHFML